MAWQELVEFITNGEPVRAGVANRAPRTIDGNVRHLRDLLLASIKGEALIAFGKTIHPSVLEGQAVYFDHIAQRFDQGLAQTDLDPLTAQLVTSRSSQIWGVVLRKISANKADILLGGIAEVDLSQAAIGGIELGKVYYLSGTSPGKLTHVRPPVGVPVLIVGQQAVDPAKHEVLVITRFTDFLADHSHMRFDLQAVPAGDHTPPTVGEAHVITVADDGIEGWLPAGHASFGGLAPAGAKFGYNLAVSSLAAVWPPVPLHSASIEIYRKSVYDSDPRLPTYGRVPDAIVVINADGIWWMSDCYNEVPWPTNLDTGSPVSISTSCPAETAVDEVLLTLWYTHYRFFTGQTAVLSLRGRPDSGVSVYCRGTDDLREVGHLEIDFDLGVLLNGQAEPGYVVFKNYDSTTKTFKRGPVAESIRSLSPEVVIDSDVATQGENGERYGNISIYANLDINGAELPVETVRLDGVEEEFYKDIIGLGFPNGRASEFRGLVRIPRRVSLPSGTKMKLRFWVLGRIAGTLGAAILPLTYRRLSAPSTVLTSPVALPLVDTALAMNTAATFANADEYVEMESAEFDVATGDVIEFTISRAASDGYGDKLIMLRHEGVLVAGGS